MAYTTPTADQIAQVAADHTKLNALLQGASADEAAMVVVQAINSVQASTLTPAAKAQATSLLHTRGLLLSGETAPRMVSTMLGKLDKALVPVIAASTAIAVGGTEGPVIGAIKQASGPANADVVATALADPVSVLGADNVAVVQAQVIEMRGVAAAVIPPPATAPLNLVPPVVPEGAAAATPPAAATYTGQ